jgi:4-hydroxybenzoate polyprenyltransferase
MPNLWQQYWQLCRAHRRIGYWLLLWPGLFALWLAAGGCPPVWLLAVFVSGSVVMRSAGCVFNDICDQRFDAQITRTAARPLAAGQLSVRQAYFLLVGLLFVALLLLLCLPQATWGLAGFSLALIVLYSFSKRFFACPQLLLGLAFAWPVFMAYSALGLPVSWQAGCLYLAIVCWVIAFDTAYALQDAPMDSVLGLYSLAVLLGRSTRAAACILLLQACFLWLLLCLRLCSGSAMGPRPWLAWLLGWAVVGYQQYLLALGRRGQPHAYQRAFCSNHQLAAIMFFGFFL